MEEKTKNIYTLHDESLKWINELEFISDEQIFLENLLSSHFLQLSSSEHYDAARKLIKKLKDVEKSGRDLMDTIELHNKASTSFLNLSPILNNSCDKIINNYFTDLFRGSDI